VASEGGQLVRDPEFVRIAARYDLYKQIVRIGYILASALPIWAMVPIAQAFAGHQTNLTVTITAGITVTAILGGGNAWQYVVGRGRRRELQRIRERLSTLEEELKAAKEQK
jgi:hypothetical protein